ncbi:regulator of G protein signaling superfamily [Backusella circina FSU 941]|nr:regulator of G protein signaling superfamily [Backusella circina FSU 941]
MDSSALTLESVLEDPNSNQFQQFTAYLNQSYCIENLGFWLAAQRYKACQEQDLPYECTHIINRYIHPNSPQEINIPCDMRQTIIDYYNKGQYEPTIFDSAADSVLELMRVNSFLPWLMNSWSSDSSSICSSPTTATDSNNNPHTSWPIIPLKNKKKSELSSSTSLAALSSFSISDKWQMIKTKQLSRRSCSSLDESRLSSQQQSFLTNIAIAEETTINSGRYKSMLKRVKRSLLGHPTESQNLDDTPLSMDSSWSYWSKSQR